MNEEWLVCIPIIWMFRLELEKGESESESERIRYSMYT